MKTIITLLISLLSINGIAQKKSYLKISLDDNNSEVNYPPDTRFILQDEQGETILNHEELEKIKSYEVTSPSTLYIFTTWNTEPDRFELMNSTLTLPASATVKEKRATQNFQFSEVKYGDPISIEKKRLISSSKENMTNLSLVFSNGIIFYFKDGNAQAWLDGTELEIKGEYIINSTLGTLKLSYDPYTTDLWYVFEAAK
ncbi:hypothetical protein GCM10009117_09170 [Gangjinia marincola]|uniref:Uncharacterized protein n=1 Tax=Gangjinia marincola TaxID=578463 RepID=A0ABN1MFE4_9FLAO